MFGSWWVLYFWWGPFSLMRWSYMLQGLGEHTGLTHRPETLFNTRTFRTGFFFRWVNWNIPTTVCITPFLECLSTVCRLYTGK